MLYLPLILTLFFCYCHLTDALVTVLCNYNIVCGGEPPLCTYIIAACVLMDNGHQLIHKINNYPLAYHSGGFDGDGFHVEYYFGEDWSVSIETPNGGKVSMMQPASNNYGHLYFAFNDRPAEVAANDAYIACLGMNVWTPVALGCDDVREEALRVYRQN